MAVNRHTPVLAFDSGHNELTCDDKIAGNQQVPLLVSNNTKQSGLTLQQQ